jgi:3-hydroxyisobutyrate dehydrogenase-like beta-hydroxyacid dehydrogenase
MTSALPSTVRIVEQEALSKGIGLLDAPVSGGVARAAEGSLTIMVGGSKELADQCYLIWQAMGKTIFYTGEV